MILVDANLLVYAHVADFEQHERARAWLDDQLARSPRLGLPWESVVAFLRLVTNARLFRRPETVARAWRQVQAWLESEAAWVPVPTARHGAVLESLLAATGASADLVPDAHLAALAIEHGLVLASTDGDFARFPGLRWDNPLAATS